MGKRMAAATIQNTLNQFARGARAAVGSDARFFQNTSKKGETHELREVSLVYIHGIYELKPMCRCIQPSRKTTMLLMAFDQLSVFGII